MNANYEPHAISRRTFLKGAGAVGAAGLLAACGGPRRPPGRTAPPRAASPLKYFFIFPAACE